MRTTVQEGHPAMTTTRHRANPLMLLPGLLLVLVGVVVMVGGLAWAVLPFLDDRVPQLSDLGVRPDPREDLQPLFDGFATFAIGTTVLTVGRYLWRGARRRGWRDRLGRLLLIIGYLTIGADMVLLTRFALAAMGEFDGGGETMIRGMIIFALVAIPAAALVTIGLRLAKEEPLMEASAEASF
jgi:hypothetical protein